MRLDEDIAIVGISVFTPAGSSVGEFWDNISRGKDFITEAPEDVVESYHFEGDPNGIDRFYTNRGGFIPPFKVDPIRYGIMPLVADATDPEQLISLAGVEQALRDAGVFEKGISLNKGSIIIGKGNFSGPVAIRMLEIIHMSQQYANLLKVALPELTDEDVEKIKQAYQSKQGRYQTDMATGTMPNLIASIVANRFDIHGPAYTIDGACASGILAINQSIDLLRSGKSDIAIAGGMHVGYNQPTIWSVFNLMEEMSKSEKIAPFSEDADGLLLGQGSGFVVLKTLRKAIEDGDRIYSVIKETAIGNDGASPHLMETTKEGQVRVLKQAWEKSGLDPQHVSYIEAHGSGIKRSDQMEIATLKAVFGDQNGPEAYLGSIKSNIGHLMPASGMIGLIKTALALYYRKIPPTLHCENPLAEMSKTRFTPATQLIDWDGEKLPLIAGVNSFGLGGVNTHVVLTAYEPAPEKLHLKPKPYLGEAYVVTAKNQEALLRKMKNGDYTNTGGDYRLVILDPNEIRLKQAIRIIEKDKPWRGRADIWFTNAPLLTNGGKIVAMLPGFDFRTEANYDDLSTLFELPYLNDLTKKHAEEIERLGKPSQMIHEWEVHYMRLLGKQVLEKLGVNIDMYAGHSVGEWDAIILSGMLDSFTNEIKEKIIAALFDEEALIYPLVVVNHTNRDEIDQLCEMIPNLWLMADNCPSQLMLGGDETAMNALLEKLKEKNIFHTAVIKSLGFHTPLAKDWLEATLQGVETLDIREGSAPVWSASALEKITTDKDHFKKLVFDQLMVPVYFRQLIEKLYHEEDARIFIQLGFGGLSAFVEDTLKGKDFGVAEAASEIRSGVDQFRRISALLFSEGHEIDPKFLGVNLTYQVENSVMTLPRGLRPIITNFPELDAIIVNRYGDVDTDLLGKFFEVQNTPLRAFANENIQQAMDIQRQLRLLFEEEMASGIGFVLPQEKRKTSHQIDQFGDSFEEKLELRIEENMYLLDHAVIQQPEAWPITEDLDPVVPFTMTIELFAEFAMKHAPGKKVLKLKNISVLRWLSLMTPLDIEVKGKWIAKDTLLIDFSGYASAQVVLGDSYLAVDETFVGKFDIGTQTGKISREEFYEKYQFHGVKYQSAISDYIDIYQRGTFTLAESKEGKGSLLDSMGQQLAAYLHLTQEKNTIAFPIRLKEITFFGDMFDQEGLFEHTLEITRLSEYLIHGNMRFVRDGKIWAVAHDFVCQRFINIKEVGWVILTPYKYTLAKEIAPNVFHYEMENPNTQKNVLFILYKRYFGAEDRETILSLEPMEAKFKYLIKHIVLKDAVRAFAKEEGEPYLYPIEFYTKYDEMGRPYVKGHGHAAEKVDHLFASFAQQGYKAIAIASDEPVGIDLEKIEEKSEGFIKLAYTEKEIELLNTLNNDFEMVIRFWVAKAAFAKKIGKDLRDNPKVFEVSAIEGDVLTVNDGFIQTMKIGDDYIAGWTL